MTVYSVKYSLQLPEKKHMVVTNHIYANSKGEVKIKALNMAKTAAFISVGEETAKEAVIEIIDIF